MKIQTELLCYILNMTPKHNDDQSVFVYSRACARDGHHSGLCISCGAANDVLAQRRTHGSHLLPDGFLEVGDDPGLP